MTVHDTAGHQRTTAPDDIDESFVARAAEGMVVVPAGGEAVLVDAAGNSTLLSATGAVIWACLDGEATLGEIIDDLSEQAATDRAVVATGVVTFARGLGAAGALDGVAPRDTDDPFDGEFALVPVVDPVTGDELDDFTLGDLDGSAHSLSQHRGREVLLVHWNPDCGYCALLAEGLSALQKPFVAEGVDLVFVASGDVDANRRMFEAVGLRAPALLLDGTCDPFVGHGTPTAYHVDREGRLAAPMAFGAFEVAALAAALAGVDPTSLTEAGQQGTKYLLADSGLCGTNYESSGSVAWQGTRAYRIGDFHVGLRHNSSATAATLDALFPEARVDDPRAQHSYSVALFEPTDEGSHPLNLLVQGGVEMVRSRSRARLLRALLGRLSDDIVGFDLARGRLRVRATAARFDDRAVLLPDGLLHLSGFQPRFAHVGVAFADVRYPEIDLDTAELVVPEPAIPYDASVIAALDEGVSLGSEPPPVLPGRYPLDAWFMLRDVATNVEMSPATGAVAALPWVHDVGDVAQVRERVEQLAALFTQVRAVGIWYNSEAGMVAAVQAGLR